MPPTVSRTAPRRVLSSLLGGSLLALGAGPAAAGGDDRPPLSAAEQAIVATIDAGEPAAVSLLQRLVDVNSGTMNFAGVRRAGELVEPELAGLGFATRWVDGAPFGRAGHLLAERSHHRLELHRTGRALGDRGLDHVELRLRLLGGHAVFQPGDHGVIVLPRRRPLARRERQRH